MLLKYFKTIFLITGVAVLHTHMQMVIIDLAYQGKEKERQINTLQEERQNVTSKIFAMESSNNLGDKVLVENSDMQFMHPQDVIEFSSQKLPAQKIAQNTRGKASERVRILNKR